MNQPNREKMMRLILLFFTLGFMFVANAYDRYDVMACEAKGGYTIKAKCYEKLGLSIPQSCTHKDMVEKVDCYRTVANNEIGIGLTLTNRPESKNRKVLTDIHPIKPNPKKSQSVAVLKDEGLRAWNAASNESKLMASAGIVIKLTKQRMTKKDIALRASELKVCIDEVAADSKLEEFRIPEIAAGCAILLGYTE